MTTKSHNSLTKIMEPNYEEDLDCIDFKNYKGIFFDDDPNSKYQDPETGAHFDYFDMCKRLRRLQKELVASENRVSAMEERNTKNKFAIAPRDNLDKRNQYQFLQALLKAPGKESRNAVRVLPQQGYGTAGVDKKEPQYLRNIKLFSSQIEEKKKIDREDSEGVDRPYQGPTRSKSHENHENGQSRTKIPLYPSMGPAKKCNLYELQRNIEEMLRNTHSHPYNRGVNYKNITSNAEKNSHKIIVVKKSRNNASGVYDNKTYDYRAGVWREGSSDSSSAYHTKYPNKNSFGPLFKKKLECGSRKKSVLNHHALVQEPIKKIKISLHNINRKGCQSRNTQIKSYF